MRTRGFTPRWPFLAGLVVLLAAAVLLGAGPCPVPGVQLSTSPADLPPPVSPGSIVLLSGGRILVGDSGVGRFWTLAPDLGGRTPLPGGDREATEPEGMALAPDGRVYVADLLQRSISLLDPDRGTRDLVSGSGRGSGAAFDSPQDVAVAPDGAVWVSDPGRPGLWRVDPRTGDRFEVAGTGPAWGEPFSLAFAPDGELYVTDLRLSALVRVHPSTGNRRLVSWARRGRGPKLDTPTAVLPGGDGTLLVGDSSLRALFRVDPATGDRTLVAGPGRGSGPELHEPMSLAHDGAGRVLVGDAGMGAVVRVDPATGDRESSPGVPGSERLSEYEALCASPEGEVWCLVEHGRELVQLLPGPRRRVLPRQELLEPLVVASLGDRLVLGDRGDNTFLSLDPVTGEGSTVPGASCRHVPSLAALPDGRVVYYDGLGHELVELDPRTGGRHVLSGPDHPGPPLRMPVQIAVAGDREFFVADETSAAVLRVERATGRRTLVSGAGRGGGEPFLYPDGLGRLPDGDLCVADQGRRRLVRVDLHTGDRSPLFPPESEPDLPSPGKLVVLPEGSIVILDQVLGPVQVDLGSGRPTLLDPVGEGS